MVAMLLVILRAVAFKFLRMESTEMFNLFSHSIYIFINDVFGFLVYTVIITNIIVLIGGVGVRSKKIQSCLR